VKAYPHLRNRVTDLLIGDLFDDKVDEVWEPMESMYPPEKQKIPTWDKGTAEAAMPDKVSELFLPAEELR
jgi:hypothetical protein